jgi:hypothetical protein
MSKSLLATNPYLRDPQARKKALRVSAASSSAVEGIRKPFAPKQGVKVTGVKAGSRPRAKSAG